MSAPVNAGNSVVMCGTRKVQTKRGQGCVVRSQRQREMEEKGNKEMGQQGEISKWEWEGTEPEEKNQRV